MYCFSAALIQFFPLRFCFNFVFCSVYIKINTQFIFAKILCSLTKVLKLTVISITLQANTRDVGSFGIYFLNNIIVKFLGVVPTPTSVELYSVTLPQLNGCGFSQSSGRCKPTFRYFVDPQEGSFRNCCTDIKDILLSSFVRLYQMQQLFQVLIFH